MSAIKDYDPGLINPECGVIESVRYHVESANAYWQEEADQFEEALAAKDAKIAEQQIQIVNLVADQDRLRAQLTVLSLSHAALKKETT